MDDTALLAVLHDAADAARTALDNLEDWGLAPDRSHPGQHVSDQVADDAVRGVLDQAGLGVLSEESGLHYSDREVLVVVDPVDGSTNAAHGIPWFATSLCALDGAGPRAALVVNLATGMEFSALRGGGAFCDGVPMAPSPCTSFADALVGFNSIPAIEPGWRQARILGAAALDLCAVGAGILDAYIDFTVDALGPWDYLGGLLVCQEAGASVEDAWGRDLVVREHAVRRTPVAASTPALLAQVRTARNSVDSRRGA